MAAVLPINFPIPGENVLANYNYQDIATGSGYATFYATCNYTSAAALEYSLIANAIEAHENRIFTGRNTDTTYTFDITFNSPRVLNGNCYVVVPFFNYVYSSNNSTTTCYASLFKYSGSTETQIGSTVSLGYTSPASETADYFEMLSAIIVPASQVNFKKGDKLRLKIRILNGNSVNANTGGGIYVDPKNSSFTGSERGDCRTKVLSISIPFKINN